MSKQTYKSKNRTQKVLVQVFAIVSLLCPMRSLLLADDSLADWSQTFSQPAVQQKILDRIFPGKIGSVSEAVKRPKDGMLLFPKGGFWVQLGDTVVYSTMPVPTLVVTSTFYQRADQDAINSTAYIFRTPVDRPVALSAGYAQRERVEKVTLPKLNKSFLVLSDSSAGPYEPQWSASLLEIGQAGMSDHPKAVWVSPMAVRRFQFGFDALGGSAERIVVKITPRSGEDPAYKAYRWNGERFEEDIFASERLMKALPAEVWRYGAGQ